MSVHVLFYGKVLVIPIKEKNMNLNNLTWQEIMALCLRKFQYEKSLQSYRNLPVLRRLLTRKPHDPAPGLSSEAMASRYVQAFNRCHSLNGTPFGIRQILPDAYRNDSVHIVLRYQAEDRLPILTATYYEDGTAYVESVKVFLGGSTERQPIRYPYSEIGIYGLPKRPKVNEVAQLKRVFESSMREIQETLR